MEVVVRYHGIVGSRGKDRHEEQHQRLRRNPHPVFSSLAVLGGCGFPQMWTKSRPSPLSDSPHWLDLTHLTTRPPV